MGWLFGIGDYRGEAGEWLGLTAEIYDILCDMREYQG